MAGRSAFVDGLFVRWFIPIFIFVYPKLMNNFARRHLSMYKNKAFAIPYDCFNSYISIAFATVVALASIEPMG